MIYAVTNRRCRTWYCPECYLAAVVRADDAIFQVEVIFPVVADDVQPSGKHYYCVANVQV